MYVPVCMCVCMYVCMYACMYDVWINVLMNHHNGQGADRCWALIDAWGTIVLMHNGYRPHDNICAWYMHMSSCNVSMRTYAWCAPDRCICPYAPWAWGHMRKENSIYQPHQLCLSANIICPHAYEHMSLFWSVSVIDVTLASVLIQCCVRTYAIDGWGERHLSTTYDAWGQMLIWMRTCARKN